MRQDNPNDLRATAASALQKARQLQESALHSGRELTEAEGKEIDRLLDEATACRLRAKGVEAAEDSQAMAAGGIIRARTLRRAKPQGDHDADEPRRTG